MYLKNSISDTRFDTLNNIVPKPLKTKIVPRTRQNRDGRHTLYLHVTGSNQRWRHNLDLHVFKKNWSQADQNLIKTADDYYARSLVIENIKAKCTEIKTRYKLLNTPLTVDIFEQEFLNDLVRVHFVGYVKFKLPKLSDINEGTMRRYESIVTKISKWNPNLTFSDIDSSFPDRYRSWCKKEGNQSSTIESNCAFIKKMLRLAEDDNIKFPLNLKRWKIKGYRSNREYLLPEETKKLLKYYKGKRIFPEHKIALGHFLISCLTGLRISEIEELERFDGKQTMLQVYAPKTGKKTTIYRTKQLSEILDDCPELCSKYMHRNTINKHLKYVARRCKIDKTVSMHVGRHTFAMEYLRTGGSVLKLRTILKHSKLDTTMKYVHQLDEEQSANIELVGTLYA